MKTVIRIGNLLTWKNILKHQTKDPSLDTMVSKVTNRRVRIGTTIATTVAFLLYCISVGLPVWIHVRLPPPETPPAPDDVVKTHSGLWQRCLIFRDDTKACSTLKLLQGADSEGQDYDSTFTEYSWCQGLQTQRCIAYRRAGAAFSVLALFMAVVSHVSAIYTFRNSRYMYKRLTAFLHLITAACVLVQIEVFVSAIDHAKTTVPSRVPKGSTTTWGACYGQSWFSFCVFVMAAVIFLVLSRKKKHDESSFGVSETEAHDEPQLLGRA